MKAAELIFKDSLLGLLRDKAKFYSAHNAELVPGLDVAIELVRSQPNVCCCAVSQHDAAKPVHADDNLEIATHAGAWVAVQTSKTLLKIDKAKARKGVAADELEHLNNRLDVLEYIHQLIEQEEKTNGL